MDTASLRPLVRPVRPLLIADTTCIRSLGNLLPGFTLHFSLVANLAPLVDDLPATGHDSHNNRAYWKLNFHIKAFIGGTSLKARLEWTDSRVRVCAVGALSDRKLTLGRNRV